MNPESQNIKGVINRCPSCDAEVKVDQEILFGDLKCSNCSTKLWFLSSADSARFFDHAGSAGLRERAIHFVAERLEIDAESLTANPNMVNDLDTDSLEALELLMDLEEELDLV